MLSLTRGQTTLLPFGRLTDSGLSCRMCCSVLPPIRAKGGSGANPLFTSDELAYQIQATKASVIITHPESLPVALSATRATNLPAECIILFDVDSASYGPQTTVQSVIDEGLANPSTFQERVLRPGEGKTKVAFLNFSSGTTGRPKVRILRDCHEICWLVDLCARLLQYPIMHR